VRRASVVIGGGAQKEAIRLKQTIAETESVGSIPPAGGALPKEGDATATEAANDCGRTLFAGDYFAATGLTRLKTG